MKPCIFYDRDGIVNVPPEDDVRYVLSADAFRIIPAFIDCLRITRERGYEAVIITNQKCVGRGLLDWAGLNAIHDKLRKELAGHGLSLLDIYVSPHLEDDHPERKPNPGMILKAAEEHHLDLSRSWMVGDNEKDITAGRAAGCSKTVRVTPGIDETKADLKFNTMGELASYLEQKLASA